MMSERRPRRSDDERGTAMIELAFVALLLFSFSAAAVDFGFGWRSGLAVTEATRAGARVGSALGPQTPPDTNGREADFYAASSAKAALSASGKLDNVKRLVIYKATSLTGEPSAPCKAGTGNDGGKCTVVTGANLRTNWDSNAMSAETAASGCLNIASYKGFCPTARVNSPQGSAEYLGVYIVMRHDYMFPILGSGTDVARFTVMRIEPKAE